MAEELSAPIDLRTYDVTAPKPMMMRIECELQSAKAGELPLDARVRILASREMPDGSRRSKIETIPPPYEGSQHGGSQQDGQASAQVARTPQSCSLIPRP